MSLVTRRSTPLRNSMSFLSRSNGQSVRKSSEIYFSTDPRNLFISDYHRSYTNSTNYGNLQYYDLTNPILSTYENCGRIDTRHIYPRVHDWNKPIIIKTYGSTGGKDTLDLNINEKQNSYKEDDQINTYFGNYHGFIQRNVHGPFYFGKVQMSTYRDSDDGNNKSSYGDKVDGNVNTTYGGDHEGDKQRQKCGDDKDGKDGKVLPSKAPICLACAAQACSPRCPCYDSRKFKHCLAHDDVHLNFERIPNVPTGVFRPTDGECLGHNHAAKFSCYQNPEYFSFHNMTFLDMHLAMRPMRRPCPVSGRKP